MIQKLEFRPGTACLDGSIEPDSPELIFTARWIDDVDEMRRLSNPWQRLIARAVQPNFCFEPNYLIPAFEHLNQQDARLLVIEAPSMADPSQNILCGLVPFRRRRVYGLPFRALEVWKHDQCFDATPLVRDDCANETLCYLFEFLAQEGVRLISFDTVANEGPFLAAFDQACQQNKLVRFDRDQFDRACFRPLDDAETYIKTHVSKSIRKNTRRLFRRLEEKGKFEVRLSDEAADFDRLAQQFMEIEASGWKREAGTALKCQPASQKFFEAMVRESALTGRVRFLSLMLNGEPIAMLCDLYSTRAGYSYKTAFDEDYSCFSPGMLAEVKNIEIMHQYDVEYVDSCTDPDNQTMNRIWGDRIAFQNVIVSLKNGPSAMAVKSMPAMQKAAALVKRWRASSND